MSSLIPRISLEELPRDLAAFLTPRVQRLGYLGEFFQCAGHQPEALLSFLHFTEHLKHALPNDLTEVVVLTISVLLDNAYERIQHERLCIKLGFTEAWLEHVLSLSASAQTLGLSSYLVQRLTIAAVQRGGRDTRAELDAVVESIGSKQAVAVLLLIGRYIAHSVIVNTLELEPPAATQDASSQEANPQPTI